MPNRLLEGELEAMEAKESEEAVPNVKEDVLEPNNEVDEIEEEENVEAEELEVEEEVVEAEVLEVEEEEEEVKLVTEVAAEASLGDGAVEVSLGAAGAAAVVEAFVVSCLPSFVSSFFSATLGFPKLNDGKAAAADAAGFFLRFTEINLRWDNCSAEATFQEPLFTSSSSSPSSLVI